jgi:pimeloyl-ACP methyl ester carboxylesterase
MPHLDRPDGARLFYEVFGAGDPVVLLEGLGGHIPGWRRSLPRLSATLQVVACDLRGNGRSEAPDVPMTVPMLAEDTLGLLDHLGIESAHLYGQSLGGMVALQIALDHPSRARSLVLAATHAGLRHAVPSDHRAPKDEPWRLLYSPSFPEGHPEEVAEDRRLASEHAQTPGAARRQWEAVQRFDVFDRLGEIRAPTLVLHGTEDRLIHPDNARILAERIPGARLVLLEGAGHAYHSEQPEAADDAVLSLVGGGSP